LTHRGVCVIKTLERSANKEELKLAKGKEFFEVFKMPSDEEPSRKEASGGLKKPAPARASARKSRGYEPKQGISVTPGRITLSLSHMGAAVLLLCLLGIMLVSFALGVAYGRRQTAVTPERLMSKASERPEQIVDVERLSTWKLDKSKGVPIQQVVTTKKTATPTAKRTTAASTGYWTLQLISGIPADRAAKIARELRERGYDAVAVLKGKMSAVRVGKYDSPDSVSARRAKALFQSFRYEGKKQFADCTFVKVRTR